MGDRESNTETGPWSTEVFGIAHEYVWLGVLLIVVESVCGLTAEQCFGQDKL
jgi:hypothetical protein